MGAAQSVEHYEIARYGTLIAWAESLGHDDIVRFLNTNLNEEKAADKKLSTVALRSAAETSPHKVSDGRSSTLSSIAGAHKDRQCYASE